MALAAAPWHLIVLRSLDRIGKGVRTAPRDALIAESTPQQPINWPDKLWPHLPVSMVFVAGEEDFFGWMLERRGPTAPEATGPSRRSPRGPTAPAG